MAAKKRIPTEKAPSVLTGRLEDALFAGITKLSDAISDLASNIATHQERLDNVDRRANSHATDIQRLETHHQAVSERINGVQNDLTEKMAKQTESLKAHLDGSVAKIVDLVKESDKKREDGDLAILARVAKLEIWRWMIAGGAVVGAGVMSGVIWKIVSAVVDKIDWVKFFTGQP